MLRRDGQKWPIGSVGFTLNGHIQDISGMERSRLLRKAYLKESIEPYTLAVIDVGCNLYNPITWNEIYWETSSVSKEKNYAKT